MRKEKKEKATKRKKSESEWNREEQRRYPGPTWGERTNERLGGLI